MNTENLRGDNASAAKGKYFFFSPLKFSINFQVANIRPGKVETEWICEFQELDGKFKVLWEIGRGKLL